MDTTLLTFLLILPPTSRPPKNTKTKVAVSHPFASGAPEPINNLIPSPIVYF
jgi:hypothetical protein